MIFLKKIDAVNKLRKSNNDDLRLIQKDSDEHGSKKFMVLTQNELYDLIKKNQNNDKASNYYESWLKDSRILFSLDIDAPKDINNDEFDKLIIKNIKTIIKYAKDFYDYNYKTKDVIVLKTNKQPNKQSSHVIFRGLSFENYIVCKNFFSRVIKEKKLEYCDSSIYRETCLRTCFSTKKGKDYPLKPHKLIINKESTCTIEDYISELDYFVQTLITTIDSLEKKNKMITNDMIIEESEICNNKIGIKDNKIEIKDNSELEQILNSLPEEYYNDYIKWNKVGMALFSINNDYFEIFNKWSQQSSKYNYSDVLKQWNGYKNSNLKKNLLGIGSLIHWAKEGGYEFPDKNIENIVVSYPEIKIEITENDSYDISYISKNKLSEKIFKPNLNKKILAIQNQVSCFSFAFELCV